MTLAENERLGFGRANLGRGGVGWGYPGRFLELSAEPHIHRRWGEIVRSGDMWCVRNLGTRWPIEVLLPHRGTVSLTPWLDRERALGAAPDSLGISHRSFSIVLQASPSRFELQCEVTGADDESNPGQATGGAPTAGMASEVADSITENEFAVLWAMSKQYREAAVGTLQPGVSPEPLTYYRVRRMLALSSDRQATAATERLIKRFRDACLLEHVDPAEQRGAMCSIAVHQGVLAQLEAKYGLPLSGVPSGDTEPASAPAGQDLTGSGATGAGGDPRNASR